jgi:hypothetical protein
MKTDDIRWQSFERSDLPKALFGSARSGVRSWHMENALDTGHGIALGYAEEEQGETYSPPAVIVLEDKAAAETLSWLKTFAPETSPLSQFARVVSRSDWERFGAERRRRPRTAAREDRWACVVLGELLAQGDSDLEVATLPLSWSASCFSTAVARSAIIHATEDARRICVERLLVLEKDQKFARRHVAIASLEPVWAPPAASRAEDTLAVSEVVDLVVSAITRAAEEPTDLKVRPATLFSPQSDLMSDSVESRVVAFQRLTAQIGDEVGERAPTALEQAVIAAGAFLVGRGSSHSFLLSRLPRRWSHTFTWFGLMAGLAGPQSWDGEWSRAAKGIERFLRGTFDWCGVSGADLSWPEYSWLTSTFTGKQVFAELPKMLPKVLSVEVVPGAICQLRLATDSPGAARDASQRETADAERRERELRDTLDQVASLATRARQLVGGQEAQRTTGQGSFALDDTQERESSASRSRRGKRH